MPDANRDRMIPMNYAQQPLRMRIVRIVDWQNEWEGKELEFVSRRNARKLLTAGSLVM